MIIRYYIAISTMILIAVPASAEDTQYVLHIDGITCPFCVATSENALRKIDGVKAVSSSLKDGTITVCASDDKVVLTDARLVDLFRKKGFTYRGMEKERVCGI